MCSIHTKNKKIKHLEKNVQNVNLKMGISLKLKMIFNCQVLKVLVSFIFGMNWFVSFYNFHLNSLNSRKSMKNRKENQLEKVV